MKQELQKVPTLMHDFDENPEDFITNKLDFSLSYTPQYFNIMDLKRTKLDYSKYDSHNYCIF
jgi:hypothetical protein